MIDVGLSAALHSARCNYIEIYQVSIVMSKFISVDLLFY
jgi:predicted nucleic-acid-binding Zn-ribbon protein